MGRYSKWDNYESNNFIIQCERRGPEKSENETVASEASKKMGGG